MATLKTTHDKTVAALIREGWKVERTGKFGMNLAGGKMRRYKYTELSKGNHRITVNHKGGTGGWSAASNLK